MKVYIGPYRNRLTCQVHYDYMNKKYKFIWDDNKTRFESFLEKVEDAVQWFYDKTINRYLDSRKRNIKVKIHNYDTWSMDNTLAYIIVPMLKQLKNTKHGSPWVNDEDVPLELRSTSAPSKENDYDTDQYHHDRWEWALNQMIWTFEQELKDDWESQYYQFEDCEPDPTAETFLEQMGTKLIWEDPEGRKAHQERMTNGFRLFGKYYQHLWD
jgi:hypothetical protein